MRRSHRFGPDSWWSSGWPTIIVFAGAVVVLIFAAWELW